MLGTAGGMYHFRDQIRLGNPTAFFVLNGDVCSDFPLNELYEFHKSKNGKAEVTIMSTEATKQQSIHYGCLVMDSQTGAVNHYVEKPSSYVSTFINCGIYVCSLDVFTRIAAIFHSRDINYSNGNGNGNRNHGYIQWEREILTNLAGTGQMFALSVNNWWSQIKTAGSAIYANRRFLDLYRRTRIERLAKAGNKDASEGADGNELICNIIGDVYIHPSASIHPTATVNNVKYILFHSICLFYYVFNSWDQMFQLEQMLILVLVFAFENLSFWTMQSSQNTLWCCIALVRASID